MHVLQLETSVKGSLRRGFIYSYGNWEIEAVLYRDIFSSEMNHILKSHLPLQMVKMMSKVHSKINVLAFGASIYKHEHIVNIFEPIANVQTIRSIINELREQGHHPRE